MKHDMTKGSPLKLLVAFAIPLLLGNILQQTYNIVDAIIVGRFLGSDALACVGGTSSVQFLINGFCIGTCAGFGIPIATCFGAKDQKGMKERIFHSLVLSAGLAVIFALLCCSLTHAILGWLNTPKNIYKGTYQYIFIIFLGIPCTILYNIMASILRALGNSKIPFIFLMISTVLNIFLDCYCIMVLKMGVSGAALATIFSQLLSGILCLIYIISRKSIFNFEKDEIIFRWKIAQNMISMGVPMGLQYSITAIGMMIMQSANNSLGSDYIAGFTAAMKIKQFAMCPFDAFATSITVYCGQNLGARKKERIKQGYRQGLIIACLYGFFAGLVLIFFGRILSSLFIGKGDSFILDAAVQYLRWMGYLFFTLGYLNITRSAIQGLGHSGITVFSGCTEMIVRGFVSLTFVGAYGFNAICITDQCAWISACIFLFIVYRHVSGKIYKEI